MLSWLLLPFSGLYGFILTIRNWLYDNNLFKSVQPETYTLSVGNLTVGGTGKTPMIEFLIERQRTIFGQIPDQTGHDPAKRPLATVSRGYGRQTRGFRIATDSDTATTIGDEPLQIYRKFRAEVRVCVGERRVAAIQQLTEQHPETQLVLLDDAFQHRAVRPHLSLMLMDINRPFYEDHPFPAGRLRERRQGANRADAIIVTKSPLDLSTGRQQRITEQIRRYTRPGTPVFFSGLQYGKPAAFTGTVSFPSFSSEVDASYIGAFREATFGSTFPERVRLVSGLANADPLERYVRQHFTLVTHDRFADHYAYTRADVTRLIRDLKPGEAILTTEKDWVKLAALLTPAEWQFVPFFYLPITVQFLPASAAAFEQFLRQTVDLSADEQAL
ncbi:tetraacyldisaccharide 4'-kinase [Spirosoma sp. KUDC1026]|uniref:tetraacyldisaccharide 4'-kinase n=1 Tax=Spirosoma sp. KUDC1026 TaxID=2745947 RepID=UPI00159BD839|nr:tetraacyldisaccharide 4'-kinase [Spirosoma sp. KUDC1026]QKZ13901.1 tetraacyldisaccharide 4'-kinase [Spirosoma sp. KUDC1026]